MVLKSAKEFTGGPDFDVYAALEAGACLITANNRLARRIRLGYAQSRHRAGQRAWEAPDVLPWHAFVTRARGLASIEGRSRPLLTAAQEQWIWSALVAEQGSEFLCQDRDFGTLAAEAWQLLADYRLPLPSAVGDRESEILVALAQGFMDRLEGLGREDAAREAVRVAAAIREGHVRPGARLLWAGFERLTPAQEAVNAACEAAGVPCKILPLPNIEGQVEARTFPLFTEELTTALLWARERVTANPVGRYVLVLPDLAAHRAQLLRLAREIFAVGGQGAGVPYEISLGAPLAEAPVAVMALRVWGLAGGPLKATDAASLIQSPFLAGAQSERASRALGAYGLLGEGPEIHITSVVRALRRSGCTSAEAAFARLAGLARKWPRRASASAWAGLFMGALQAVGWPGAAQEGDYQAVAAINEVLESVATLEAVAGKLSYAQALTTIEGALRDRVFQEGGGDAPVQIMGPLEALGLTFDGLWMLNLHDRVWPPVRPPHPLLPLAFQRAHRLPHAFVEDDVRYAARLIGDLTRAAPETILSSALHDGTETLRPSGVLLDRNPGEVPGVAFTSRARRVFEARAPLEASPSRAAPLEVPTAGPYGAGMLAAQAACPFRAMAQYRLRADPLEEPGHGLAPSTRGAVTHKVMEMWFAEFPEPRAWQALLTDERKRRIADTVAAAQAAARDEYAAFPAAFMALEARRMERVLGDFLKREEMRPPFAVVAREKEVTLTCGPLAVRGRIDRADLVGDRLLLIDYKTGKMPNVDWQGERPEHPQLLFYAAAQGADVAGIAYAGLSVRNGGYKAWVRDGDLIPEAHVVSDWEAATQAWPPLLARLASAFAEGAAAVDPLEGACDYCGREGFCRVSEGRGRDDA